MIKRSVPLNVIENRNRAQFINRSRGGKVLNGPPHKIKKSNADGTQQREEDDFETNENYDEEGFGQSEAKENESLWNISDWSS